MICTFYSYKGGVGRSMALANVAELLYRQGFDILVVDWDLEAPGLEQFFPEKQEEALNSFGVIDMLLEYKKQVSKEPSSEGSGGELLFKEPTAIEIYPREPNGGRLRLLSAGKRSKDNFKDYVNNIITFDWHDFYENWQGELYFEWLREKLELMADIVLIDSRTGVTEMGGVCTYQLADVVVMLCTANKQSLQGTHQMAQNLKDPGLEYLRRGRSLDVLVVPSRVEMTVRDDNTFQQEFGDLFRDVITYTGDINQFFLRMRIPYVPWFAFEEEIAARLSDKAVADILLTPLGELAEELRNLRDRQRNRQRTHFQDGKQSRFEYRGLPTLVIGVGGTGLRVLQRVKERLVETYGEMPPEILLLEFDIALQSPSDNFCGIQLSQELSQPIVTRSERRPSEMQLIQTSPSFTMDNVFYEARSGDPRWSWMEVEKMERLLPPAARSIPDGAGAFRPVGRAAFFLNYQKVEQTLRNAMRQVRDLPFAMSSEVLQGVEQVQMAMSKRNVFLVGSLAGGTGSGGLLDIAAMMRDIKQIDLSFTDIILSGLIALPRFFAQIADDLGRRVPNTYAGLRELDRFMRAHTPDTPYQFTTGDRREVEIDSILFDLCYLVDIEDYNGQPPRNNSNPEFGALPAMADFIVAHTDLRLGLRLNASNVNVTANYALPMRTSGSDDFYSYQSRRYYSALNSHTIIFPREDVAKSLSLRFLIDLIDEHLVAHEPRTGQLVVPTEPMRAEDLVIFLGKDNPTSQEKIAAELSTPEGDLNMGIFVRTLLQNAQTPDRRLNTEMEGVLRWLVEDGVQRKNVQRMIDDSLRQINTAPSDAGNMNMYLSKVRGWQDRYLGALVDENNPLGDRRGGDWEQAFGNLVTEARASMEARVQVLVLRMLNQRRQEGQGDDRTSIMRANRLGYALAVLRLLKDAVRAFIRQTEISFGETSRNLIRLRTELEEKRTQVANFRGGFLKRNPGPDYLSALRDVAETERQKLLRNLTTQMAEQFGGDMAQEGRSRSVLDEALFELEGWARTLLRVRELVAEERERHEVRRKQKYAIEVRTYITDPLRYDKAHEVEDELYRRYRPIVWRTLLGPDPMGASGPGFYWAMRPASNTYFDYEIITKEKIFRLNPRRPEQTAVYPLLGEASGAEQIAARWQEGAFRLLAEQVRGDRQARVAAYIPRLYNQQQTLLVNTILDPSSHALVQLNGIQPDVQQEEHYLAVDWTSADPQVNAFYGWFNQHWVGTNQSFLQAESDVACSFLTLYHGLELDQVRGFGECEPAYRSMNRAQGGLHLFPEERLAADYEARIPRLNRQEWQDMKRLHPEVVIGLNDAARLRSFALAVVSGLIADEETAGDREHFLKPPVQEKLRLSDTSKIDNYGLMQANDQVAARLLQAFHRYMLLGYSVDNDFDTIDYEAVGTAFRDWLGATHSDPRGPTLDSLLKSWETDKQGPSLYPLLNAESHDPRFRDLGIVLLLELIAWRSQRK